MSIKSVGPEAEMEVNEISGKQSKCEFDITLIPPLVLLELAKVLKAGHDKYGEGNHKKILINDHINHSLIHIFAHLSGDRQEGEVGHITHAICRLLFACEMIQEENLQNDN